MTLPTKQRSDHADWVPVVEDAYLRPNQHRADQLVDEAVGRIRALTRRLGATRLGYGWSGGKDSQALRIVCEAAGVDECYLGISNLEWPAFLGWATENMPDRLTVCLRKNINLGWLRDHPDMLFPDSEHASRWFGLIQGTARRGYATATNRDVILLGRRKADGNVVTGKNGGPWWYQDRGFVTASPLHDWTHEDVLTVLGAHDAPLPPNYRWPRGFRVGTGSWPARQWCSREQGWAEVIQIDRSVAVTAADAGIPGAEEALTCAG